MFFQKPLGMCLKLFSKKSHWFSIKNATNELPRLIRQVGKSFNEQNSYMTYQST